MGEMEERGPERLLMLAYGNHPRSASLKPEAVKLLRVLREGPKTMAELAGALGINIETPGGKKHFFTLIRPLRETGMIAARRAGGKTIYQLSFDGFNQFWKEVRKEAEYWLQEKSEG
ncbi:MAG: helix-turn-helix domain-containing protein [Candidatus Hadarchaeales archaeon]